MKAIYKNRGSVFCNEGAWKILNEQLKKLQPTKVFILTDNNTHQYCLPLFLEKYVYRHTPEVLIMPEGESNKNIHTCLDLWEELSIKGADRNCLIINLGGGVVTDLGGFVASTFKRGIEFINIPTSLLAMVDASVGGKNGVDLGVLKNQIGVIKNPIMVIIDTHFLTTLPEEQKFSGLVEMLKHGLIHSEKYWNKVKDLEVRNFDKIEDLIWESVIIKNNIVTKDPLEVNLRKTLNYGHTLGHAIESYCLQENIMEPLLHGQAVAIGIILTTFISNDLLNFPSNKLKEITNIIIQIFNKTDFNKEDIDAIISLLKYDKKNREGKVLFVLLKDIGDHKIDCEVPNELIYKAFKYYEEFQ